MDTPETIAQKSLEFLESKIKSEQEITPISTLPYPKEVMEKSLLGYIPVVLKNGMNVVDAKMKIHLICSALAGCIEDSDAEFISRTEDMLNRLSDKSATKGALNIDEETKKSFLSKGGTESDISRYLKLLDGVEAEHERLIAIADNALQSIK
jgi:hypothetical protein